METINPDAAVLIEDLLRIGGIRRRYFLDQWGIGTLGELPLAAWGKAMEWIIAKAALRGHTVVFCPYPESPAVVEQTLLGRVREIMDRAGSKKAGGSLFDTVS